MIEKNLHHPVTAAVAAVAPTLRRLPHAAAGLARVVHAAATAIATVPTVPTAVAAAITETILRPVITMTDTAVTLTGITTTHRHRIITIRRLHIIILTIRPHPTT